MAIIVGRVIDLNFEPFYIDMVRRGIVLQNVSLKDIPQALRDGEINAGPVSLVDSFDLEDICVPVAGFCLSASNKAGSNLLYSKKPMEELSGASVATATADSTTRKLFQVLLAEKFNVNADNFVAMPDEHDAFVIAGGVCVGVAKAQARRQMLSQSRRSPAPRSHRGFVLPTIAPGPGGLSVGLAGVF